jgi:hypothetical protein
MVEKDGDMAVDIAMTTLVAKKVLKIKVIFFNICRGMSKEEARRALRGPGPPRRASRGECTMWPT